MGALLAVSQLEAGYAGGRVLHGIDLTVDAGEAVALLGRNGAGKTTLVHTLMGMVRPSAGSVRLGGDELAGRPPHRIARSGMALVPQGRRVFAPLTVEQNLTLAARPGPWTLERVYALLPALAGRRRQRGDRLSGGEQQMVAIGRALLSNPRLLLLDEPSDGLAPLIVAELTRVLRELTGQGMAMVLVEQHLRLAFSVCDTVHILAKGTLVHRASTAAFRQDRATAYALLGIQDSDAAGEGEGTGGAYRPPATR